MRVGGVGVDGAAVVWGGGACGPEGGGDVGGALSRGCFWRLLPALSGCCVDALSVSVCGGCALTLTCVIRRVCVCGCMWTVT